jgi:hypothetical protein
MPTQQSTARPPYAPPAEIKVIEPRFTISRGEAFKRLVIVLDVVEGTLHAEDWTGGRDFHDPRLPAYYPGRDLYFVGGQAHDWFTRDARRLGWSPGHYPSFPSAPASFREGLDLMAPWAKALVDALEPLPDGGYDWTLRATAAYERIDYLTSYGKRGLLGDGTDPADPWHGDGSAPLPDRHHYGAVSFEEVLAAAGPGWADPMWAILSDADLDLVARSLVGRYDTRAEIPKHLIKSIGWDTEDKLRAAITFHKKRRDDWTLAEDNRNLPIHPVGVRAGLRRWRTQFVADAAGRPAEHARVYLTAHPEAWPAGLRAASSNHEVEQLAAALEVTAAAEHHVALVATGGVLRERRAELRETARAELAATGDAYAHRALELRQLGDRRAALLFEVASFQEGPEWDAEAGEPRYAELARVARMTRQAVRERLLGGEPVAAVPDDDVAAAVRAHLTHAGEGRSAAQLYEHVTGDAGLPVPREQLDRVLVEMNRAGDVTKRGHVGPSYHVPR